jgi:hypothetical protein
MEVHLPVDRRRQRSTGPRRAASMLATAALGCVVAGGCAAVLGIEDDVEVIQPSGDGSGGDSSGTGASSSDGGSAGAVACTSPAECAGAEIDCSVRTCIDGACGLEAKPAGSPCGVGLACNSAGQCACDDSDPTACGASTACQTKACVDGVCETTKARDGIGCDTCKQCAQGQCVVVADGTDPGGDCGKCASCQLGACVNTPAGQPDPALTCPGLASACNGNGQCQCDDDTQNGGETGVDCGAVCSIPCPMGTGCSVGPDCASKCCNAQKLCGSCEAGCTCSAPDLVCHAGGVCGD